MNHYVEFLGYFFILIIILGSLVTHVFVWINVKEINELFIKHWERKKNIYEIENRLYKLENEEETND